MVVKNDKPGAFVLDPEYPVFLPFQMSLDDPVYEELLIKPPMRGWKLHPPNMPLGSHANNRYTVWNTAQAACGVLSPLFEEIDTSVYSPARLN
jgi:hypothetical protein